jgi:2Fe-2S ferredoxin
MNISIRKAYKYSSQKNKMATLKNSKTGKAKEVKDGENIRNVAEILGVEFNCKNGVCGTCMIDIVKGEENLSPLTKEENDLKRDKKHRLACQCKIISGEVEIVV